MRALLLTLVLAGCLPANLLTDLSAEEPGTSRLAKILVGRNESLRQQALRPLRKDLRQKIKVLEDLIFALESNIDRLKDRDQLPPSTVEIIDIVASVNRPSAKQTLTNLLDSPRADVAMIAADAMGRHQHFDAIDALKMQVERPEWKLEYGFRFNLVRALLLMDHPDAYEFLIQIKKTVDGQLLHELDEQFKEVTLDNFRGDEERFKTWKNGGNRPSMFKTASFSDSHSSDSPFSDSPLSDSLNHPKLQRQQYYGIDINAKRVMFIIDHSGSMKKRTYGGTRLIRAKQELYKAIHALPTDHEFAIVFYEEHVRWWRDELVYASDENKEDAIKFVSRLAYGGSTNTHGALRRSLDFDDALETVFLLTDGQPSCGELIAAPLIVDDIVQRNQLRHLTINTIGIAVNPTTERFLKTLAEKCGGEYRNAR